MRLTQNQKIGMLGVGSFLALTFILGWKVVASCVQARKALKSIEPYLLDFGYYVGMEYHELGMNHCMVDGMAYWINVSQDCVLQYDVKTDEGWCSYFYNLTAGWNNIAWTCFVV